VKLSDVMSAMHLSSYAEVGLVLFLLAFLAVCFDVVRRGRALEELARLPLDEPREKPAHRENPS
jgi:hypothetical protein